MRILLIEDDKSVSGFIKLGLEEECYSVDVADDGKAGLHLATSDGYDLMILDVMLPKISGIDLCRRLREQGVRTPIMMLTGLDSVTSRVEGFNVGADDYLTKPFAFSELLARIKALLRRDHGFDKR
ncbi:MAG TPA: response regulator [Thermodesulfovibrionales bacterium]|nr:response regulator [Thermodesulfovibrionales bacterium]